MNIENAVVRSSTHTERVACEFVGDQSSLATHIAENYANGSDAIVSRENDGTIDVADIDGDWRLCVTLVDEE